MLFRRLLFDHVTVCCLYCRWEAKKLAVGGRRVLQQQRKHRRIAIGEELLITGVSVSEGNQRVLNDGVSASWMNDERLLEWCFMVFQQQKKRRNNCWTELFRR
jgi:hypothetical protein